MAQATVADVSEIRFNSRQLLIERVDVDLVEPEDWKSVAATGISGISKPTAAAAVAATPVSPVGSVGSSNAMAVDGAGGGGAAASDGGGGAAEANEDAREEEPETKMITRRYVKV